ncbi:uncharacterized protein SPPG_09116 [Spizellomyces punctatus DAOM BR117]|uniref:Uncharacterized protein n=1 Tax=Spizellomyces punctatus (strain DAOM BR117) TaxID=645134 RepID=A0A0L0HJK3_SPIPD|nr:uncharacterized protein SPPG_09116 [Spizellomyces punctatus DAOM BR117]KND01636.1 hypothetical protein SPPG_09116 [Spizellomyces punctatus DAOM BR117]|eukprot:XP_016609675.1 hypothetical protein SPPG_09116 [Spizellomyces punctatus DAOM BR117]
MGTMLRPLLVIKVVHAPTDRAKAFHLATLTVLKEPHFTREHVTIKDWFRLVGDVFDWEMIQHGKLPYRLHLEHSAKRSSTPVNPEGTNDMTPQHGYLDLIVRLKKTVVERPERPPCSGDWYEWIWGCLALERLKPLLVDTGDKKVPPKSAAKTKRGQRGPKDIMERRAQSLQPPKAETSTATKRRRCSSAPEARSAKKIAINVQQSSLRDEMTPSLRESQSPPTPKHKVVDRSSRDSGQCKQTVSVPAQEWGGGGGSLCDSHRWTQTISTIDPDLAVNDRCVKVMLANSTYWSWLDSQLCVIWLLLQDPDGEQVLFRAYQDGSNRIASLQQTNYTLVEDLNGRLGWLSEVGLCAYIYIYYNV